MRRRRKIEKAETIDESLKIQLHKNSEELAKLAVNEDLLLEKAYKSSVPGDILTASAFIRKRRRAKSYVFDPIQYADSLGYKDKPLNVTYRTLRNMARTPIIKSIIGTRTEQLASFSEPYEDEQRLGWTIRKKQSHLFKNKKIKTTDVEKYEIEALIEFLMNAGIKKNRYYADNFESFLRKITQDSMVLDQMTFEVIRNRGGKPIEFFAVDGATFRLAKSYNNLAAEKDAIAVNGYYPFFVQLYNGLVNSDFYPWELSFGMRNLSTNIYNNGYGVSELEDMIRIVTWLLYADQYNGSFFSQGSNPKGMFKAKGNIDEDKLIEFKQGWRAQATGMAGAHRIPLLQGAEDIEWIDMQKSNKDMEFGRWQEYLIRLSCAMYKIDPGEIGFYLGGSGQNQGAATYEGNQEYKLKYSRDKGLYPFSLSFKVISFSLISSPFFLNLGPP